MKIINIGILAHVDAGKTTLTESLLYTSGAIIEPGSVDKGTTRTDSMALERQRGITIQAAVTSFHWKEYKVNLVDTPGHMDFLTEVYRSLSVLDGAILVVSAKDGVQAQTRVLFHALRKMKIPTIIFINKIDQEGFVPAQTYQNIREKLTEDMMVMQEVHLFSELTLSDVADFEKWDAVIAGNDDLLEKYLSGAPLTLRELQEEIKRRVQQGTFFPVYHGSAKENIGTKELLDVITDIFSSKTDNCQSELCGYVFKVVALPNGRPCENRIIEKEFSLLKEKAGLPNVVFHSLRHSSTTYKLKLNHGDLKATQGDTGHAEIDMITKVYAHILDEDRKINAQKFESAFYANPDLRNVKPPQEPEQPQAQTLDLAALVEQLQKSPELASTLAALLTAQKAG